MSAQSQADRVLADMLLLATRCIFIYALEELVQTLPAVYMYRTLEMLYTQFAESPLISKLLSLSLEELRDLLVKGGYVKNITIKRENNRIKVKIEGCFIAPQLHKYMTRKEHLCPLLLLVLAALRRAFGKIRFTEKYPTLTEDGSIAELEVVE